MAARSRLRRGGTASRHQAQFAFAASGPGGLAAPIVVQLGLPYLVPTGIKDFIFEQARGRLGVLWDTVGTLGAGGGGVTGLGRVRRGRGLF